MNLYLYKNFNNYYNRMVKRYETTDGYEDYYLCQEPNINFNPNDYMTTIQIVNDKDACQADYAIIENENYDIDSRWFVIETKRKRANQWELTLRRDILADNWDQIKEAKAYIYKGQVDYGNPLLWNSEGLQLNQIKQRELLLSGEIQNRTPWIVGYVAANVQKKEYEMKVEYTGYDYLGWGPFAGLVTGAGTYHAVYDKDIQLQIGNYLDINVRVIHNTDYWSPFSGEYYREQNKRTNDCIEFIGGQGMWQTPSESLLNNIQESLIGDVNSRGARVIYTPYQVDDEVICYVNNTYYRVKVTSITDASYNKSNFGNEIASNYLVARSAIFAGSYAVLYKDILLTVESLGSEYGATRTEKFVIRDSQSLPNTGAPYKIFTMPLTKFKDNTTGLVIESEKVLPQAIAISKVLSDELYDLQIVPYCPLTNGQFLDAPNFLVITCNDASFIQNDQNDNIGVVYWCKDTTTNGIIEIPDDYKYTVGENAKVDNESLMYRICSPNYNGTFEFSPVKNNGVNYFMYDQTLKPYSPHIHIYPNFGGLYNKNFNDARGLICGGDFSLPRITDQFAQYELNNKNYQLQFDREIESMELQRNWGIAEAGVNATLGAVVGGGIAGAKYGAAGAVVGAGAGITEGVLNMAEQISLGKDKIGAAKDQYNWNLQNIKARPYNLTNIGVLNHDYKFFPFLEVYDATDVEKQMVADKVTYEGMTINVIGTVGDYYKAGGYLRCNLIRINDVSEDYNLVNAINNELMRGVYIYVI